MLTLYVWIFLFLILEYHIYGWFCLCVYALILCLVFFETLGRHQIPWCWSCISSGFQPRSSGKTSSVHDSGLTSPGIYSCFWGHLYLNLELTDSVRPACQQAPTSSCLPTFPALVLQPYTVLHPTFLWVLGNQTQNLLLDGKCFTNWSISLSFLPVS